MICPNCRAEVAANKFCSNCGTALTKEDKMSRAEFSVAWVRDILRDLEYDVSEIKKAENDAESFTARHKARFNLILDYRGSLRVLLVTSLWTAKAPGVLDRAEFFKALNSLNSDIVCCQCSVDEKSLDSLYIQYTLFVTDIVSRSDVVSFLELVDSITNRVVHQPRAKAILG